MIKKILIVQTGFLGDVILSTPLIDNLKQIYPNSSLSFLTTPLAEPLVKFNPSLNKIYTFDKRGSQKGLRGILKMAKTLHNEQFDIVFSLHKSWRTALLLKLAKIKLRFGFKRASGRLLYSKVAKREDLKHEVDRNLAILRNINIDPSDISNKEIKIFSDLKSQEEANIILQGIDRSKLICIAPGSVWAMKRWTENGFVALIKSLLKKGFSIALIGGGKQDKEIAEQIIESIINSEQVLQHEKTPKQELPSNVSPVKEWQEVFAGKLINLAGRTNLLVSAEIIRASRVIVTNDSAPLHIASAMKTKCVAIFCATIPEFGFGPWQNEHEIVENLGLSCRPCHRHGGNTCPTGTELCRKGIGYQKVENSVLSLLERDIQTR